MNIRVRTGRRAARLAPVLCCTASALALAMAAPAVAVPTANGFDWPVGNPANGAPYGLTQGFCSYLSGHGYHLGDDVNVSFQPVYSTSAGTVRVAGWRTGWGNVLV